VGSGADIKWTSGQRRGYRHNFAFGIANGAFLMLGDTLIHPTLVLALFVSQISHSNLLVGLVPVLSTGVWFLPQLFVAGFVQRSDRRLPLAIWSTVARSVSIAALGLLGFLIGGRHPSLLLVAFFVAYSIYNLTAGIANVPFVDVIARAVPANRLAFFFGQRNLWGGVLGFMAGFLIQRILADQSSFPHGFTILFALSAVALAVGTVTMALISEPGPAPVRQRTSLASQLRDAPRFFANRHFRRFLTFRAFLSIAAIADPFYVVYTRQQLGAPAAVVGIYVSILTVSLFAANLLWSPLADRQGNRLVLQFAALIRMGIPLLALALPPLMRWSPISQRGGDHLLYYAFGLVFLAYGVAITGQNLANMTYLLDIAPEQERPAYVGLVNTILGVVSFVPIIGGTLVDHFGFQVLFIVAFLIAFAGVLASGPLHEPRVMDSANLFARTRRFRR